MLALAITPSKPSHACEHVARADITGPPAVRKHSSLLLKKFLLRPPIPTLLWPMADPQQAPLLTGWCRRGGKGGALPSKCPLFCQLSQLADRGV